MRKLEVVFWLIPLGFIFLLYCPAPYYYGHLLSIVDADMARLQSAALTIGGALIGTAAIASAFILFVAQINVDRLSNVLFIRFSRDLRLLTRIGLAFFYAIVGAVLSVFSSPGYRLPLIIGEFACVICTLALLFLAYRHSLYLVSPIGQLDVIEHDAKRPMQRIERRIGAKLFTLYDTDYGIESSEAKEKRRKELNAIAPDWDDNLINALNQVSGYVERAALLKDLDVSKAALGTIVSLNKEYVHLFDNDKALDGRYSGDPIADETLNILKALWDAAVARRDEPQLEQILNTYQSLAKIYIYLSNLTSVIDVTHMPYIITRMPYISRR